MKSATKINIDEIEYFGFYFSEIFNDEFCDEFEKKINSFKSITRKIEVNNLFVPLQKINKNEMDFSFMVFELPRLTKEERKEIDLMDLENIKLKINNGSVDVSFDWFGKINWITMSNLMEYHQLLHKFISKI